MSTISLNEIDDWVEKNIKPKVKKETHKVYLFDERHTSFSVDVDSSFNIKISGSPHSYRGTPLIKRLNNPTVTYGSKIQFLTKENVDIKVSTYQKYENLLKDIPKLSVTNRDIRHAAIYITHKSNLREFAADINRISLVSPITQHDVEEHKLERGGTLYVQKMPNNSFMLKYNPQFIAECIVQDYIQFYAGTPGYKNYKGAYTSFCYLVGHELLHYRNNHFSPMVRAAIQKLIYPVQFQGDETGSLIIKNVLANEENLFPEFQNNAHMSNILEVCALNMGVGRTFIDPNENDFGGMFTGYIKIDRGDLDPMTRLSLEDTLKKMTPEQRKEMAEKGWAFTDVRVINVAEEKIGIKQLYNRTLDHDKYSKKGDENDVIWPYSGPYPSDLDIRNLLTLFFFTYLPVSKSMAKNIPQKIDGYRVGDPVVIKSTKQKGIVTAIDKDGNITVAIDEPGLADEIVTLLDQLKTEKKVPGLVKEIGKERVFQEILYDASYRNISQSTFNEIEKLSESDKKKLLKAIKKELAKEVKKTTTEDDY